MAHLSTQNFICSWSRRTCTQPKHSKIRIEISRIYCSTSKEEPYPRLNEPRHDKINKMSVHPVKTRISLGIRPVWSESLLSAWRKLGSLATHWAHCEDSDQTGGMPRLIWVFAGRTLICWFCHVAAQMFEHAVSCTKSNERMVLNICQFWIFGYFINWSTSEKATKIKQKINIFFYFLFFNFVQDDFFFILFYTKCL